MSSRHSKSLNATACTRVSTCLQPIVCLCVHIVCVSATSTHAQPLCACVFVRDRRIPAGNVPQEKMRGCKKPLTTSSNHPHTLGYLWTNESTASIATRARKLMWPLGRVCFPNLRVCMNTHRQDSEWAGVTSLVGKHKGETVTSQLS